MIEPLTREQVEQLDQLRQAEACRAERDDNLIRHYQQELATLTTAHQQAVNERDLWKERHDAELRGSVNLANKVSALHVELRQAVEERDELQADAAHYVDVAGYLDHEINQLLPRLGVSSAGFTNLSTGSDFPESENPKYLWQMAIDELRENKARLQQAVEALAGVRDGERHLLGIISQLLTFAPREDSSKMPLPGWVVAIKEKAEAALHGTGGQ